MKYLFLVSVVIIGVLLWKLDSNEFEHEQREAELSGINAKLVRENNYYKKEGIPALSSETKALKDSIDNLLKTFDKKTDVDDVFSINQVTFSSQLGNLRDTIVDTMYLHHSHEITFPIYGKPLPFLIMSGYYTSLGRHEFEFKVEELKLTILQERVKNRLVTYLQTDGLIIKDNTFFYDLNDLLPQEKNWRFTPFVGLKNSAGILASYKKINLGLRIGNGNELLIGYTL